MWLAMGGGGYDMSVVPRAWTLAYGIMLGRGFPGELPLAYAGRYGAGSLRDQEGPALDAESRAWAKRYTIECIRSLRDALDL
jgi:hypothetical protein